MPPKALYQKVLASRVFPTQGEARSWAKEKKAQFKNIDVTVKTDVEAADATRRQWVAKIYQKV